MGYLFLSIALLCGALKGYCGKKTGNYTKEYKDAIFANLIRMLFCTAIGFAALIVSNGLGAVIVDYKTLSIALLSGITTSIFVVSWLVAVKRGAYMMLDVFLMIGVIVPLMGSRLLFEEEIRPLQMLGFGLLLFAVVIMCSYNNSFKEKINPASLAILIICGISNGFTDLSQKMFVHMSNIGNIAVFNFYTYIFSAIILGVLFIVLSDKSTTANKNIKPIITYIFIMSVCLFAYSYLKTKAAAYISSAELYPLSQGASLVLSSIMSAVFFKEKLTFKCIAGIIISFIGILLINVLG